MGTILGKETAAGLPAWLPEAARFYLDHTEAGVPLRELARRAGCHASTVLRQVRRIESRRDDPLVDAALTRLARDAPLPAAAPAASPAASPLVDSDHRRPPMSAPLRPQAAAAPADAPATGPADADTVAREAARILPRLARSGATLALAEGIDRAAVLLPMPGGEAVPSATLTRTVAEAFALNDWIAPARVVGRVTQYALTPAGRAALRRLAGGPHRATAEPGFAEAQAAFADQHRIWGTRSYAGDDGHARRLRVNLAESPIAVLSRRRDRDGRPFLSADLVAAGERLREDFELAQMGARTTQNWDRFLTAGVRATAEPGPTPGGGAMAARDRVAAALRDLGPGLGDMVLRCCCYLEGLEAAERRLGWSARSGKIVLRIALMRLKRHYDERHGGAPLIG